MAYIPDDAKWYLADIVESIEVEGDPRITVHVNKLLVRADSPADACAKSLLLGKQGNARWKNEEGKRVRVRFLGLRDLQVVHDALEHGAELCYTRRRVRSAKAAKALTTPKRDLGVFAPRVPWNGPDAIDGDLSRQMKALFGDDVKTRPERSSRKAPRRKRR